MHIKYSKGFLKEGEEEASKYLAESNADYNAPTNSRSMESMIDKEIQVDGGRLVLSILKKDIGQLKGLSFNRVDLTSKITNRRYKRERVSVQSVRLCVKLTDLIRMFGSYSKHIRKDPNFLLHPFYQPWNLPEAKPKPIEKRFTSVNLVEVDCVLFAEKQVGPLCILKAMVGIPVIHYRTFEEKQEIELQVRVRVMQSHEAHFMEEIMSCSKIELQYINQKSRKYKQVTVSRLQNASCNLHRVNIHNKYNLLTELKAALAKPPTDSASPAVFRIVNNTFKQIAVRLGQILLQAEIQKSAETLISLHEYLHLRAHDQLLFISHQKIPLKSKQLSQLISNPIAQLETGCVLRFSMTLGNLTLDFSENYSIVNESGADLEFLDGTPLLKNKIYSLNSKQTKIQLRLAREHSENFELSIERKSEIFCRDLLLIERSMVMQSYAFIIKSRYIIVNELLRSIAHTHFSVSPKSELALPFFPLKKLRFTLEDGEGFQFELENIPKLTQLFSPKREQQDQLGQPKRILSILSQESNNQQRVTISAKMTLINNTGETLIYYYDGIQKCPYAIQSQTAAIIAEQFQQITLRQHLFEESFRLTLQSGERKVGKKWITSFEAKGKYSYDLVISERYRLINKTTFAVLINEGREFSGRAEANKEGSLFNPQQVESTRITFETDVDFEQQVVLSQASLNYLQMGDTIFRLAVILANESVTLLLEDSLVAHQITNTVPNIVVTVRSLATQHTQFLRSEESFSEDSFQRETVVRAGDTVQVGLVNLSKPILELQFYDVERSLDFPQKWIIDMKEPPKTHATTLVLKHPASKTQSTLVVTLELELGCRYICTVYNRNYYESTEPEIMEVCLGECSLSLQITSQEHENCTLEVSGLKMNRQKGLETTNVSLQVRRLLFREARNILMLGSLEQTDRMIDFQIVSSKSVCSLSFKSLLLQLRPLQISLRESLLLQLLNFAVVFRLQKVRDEMAVERKKTVRGQIEKKEEWAEGLSKLAQRERVLQIEGMEISETSLFLSYIKDGRIKHDQQFLADPLIKYCLLVPAMSELKIAVPSIVFNRFEGNKSALAKEVVRRLRPSIGKTLFNSIASLSFFDSPVAAADNLIQYILGIVSLQ